MLTTTTRMIVDQSKEEAFIAHVIRVPLRTNGPYTYYVGVSSVRGKAFGLISSASGEVLRQWKRVAAIEDYLAVLRGQLSGIYIYLTEGPEQDLRELMIQQYQLEEAHKNPGLDLEREGLLRALRQAEQGTDGRTSDTADA